MEAVLATTKRVEFLGLPSPYSHPDIQRALAEPIRTPQQRRERKELRKALLTQEQRRQMQGFARVQGRTELTLGPQHGLAATYVWGPRNYVAEMSLDDIERLMRMHQAHPLAFKVHTDFVVLGRG